METFLEKLLKCSLAVGSDLAELLCWMPPEPPSSLCALPLNVFMSEIFFKASQKQWLSALFVCLGHPVGISKTRFRPEHMRRIDGLFCDQPSLLSRSNRKTKGKKSIVQRCGGMNVRLCDCEWGPERSRTTPGPASETNKSGDLGPMTADTSSLSVMNYQGSSGCLLGLRIPTPLSWSAPIRNQERSRDRHWSNRCWNPLSWLLSPKERLFFPNLPQIGLTVATQQNWGSTRFQNLNDDIIMLLSSRVMWLQSVLLMATNDSLFHFMEVLGCAWDQTAAGNKECLKTGAETNSIIHLYLHSHVTSKFKSICFKLIFPGSHLTMGTFFH